MQKIKLEEVKKQKIVLIDDEVDILDVLSYAIKSMDLDVITFNDPLNALEYIKNNSVDLIISDVHMPKIKGTELVINSIIKEAKCEVVLISGVELLKSNDLESLGASVFFQKPLDLDTFEYLIKEILFLRVHNLSRKEIRVSGRAFVEHKGYKVLIKNISRAGICLKSYLEPIEVFEVGKTYNLNLIPQGQNEMGSLPIEINILWVTNYKGEVNWGGTWSGRNEKEQKNLLRYYDQRMYETFIVPPVHYSSN